MEAGERYEYIARLEAFDYMTKAADILERAGFRHEADDIRKERDCRRSRIEQLKALRAQST